MELKEALQTALDFEEKGHKIYEGTANNTKNPIIAKTFRYLANEELNHIEEIKEYMEKGKIELKGDKLEDTKKFFSMTVKDFKESLKSKISNSYESSIRKKTEISGDDLKAHETALELETSSYDFYKEQYDATKDEEAKNFFKFLMEQENAHYELIQKAYEFIKNPVGFYTEEENWVVEG